MPLADLRARFEDSRRRAGCMLPSYLLLGLVPVGWGMLLGHCGAGASPLWALPVTLAVVLLLPAVDARSLVSLLQIRPARFAPSAPAPPADTLQQLDAGALLSLHGAALRLLPTVALLLWYRPDAVAGTLLFWGAFGAWAMFYVWAAVASGGGSRFLPLLLGASVCWAVNGLGQDLTPVLGLVGVAVVVAQCRGEAAARL